VAAIALILEQGEQPSRDIFNVGSGLSISLGRLVHSVVRQLGLEVEVQMGVRPFQRLEPLSLVADISRSRGLGWRPRTNLAYAVWQLARSAYGELAVTEPEQYYD
jgi:nucleoside-diphosphate-sugar epimerase